MKLNLLLFAVVFCAVIVQNDAQSPIATFFQNIGNAVRNVFRIRRPGSNNVSAAAAVAAASGGDEAALQALIASQGGLIGQSIGNNPTSLLTEPVVAEPIYVTVTADPVVVTETVTSTMPSNIERLTTMETMFEYVTSTITETVFATEKVYDTVMQTAFVTSTVMLNEPVAAVEAAENAVPAEPFEAIV